MARASPRKKATVNYKEDDISTKKPSAAAKALGSLKSAASKIVAKAAPKRKAESDSNGADAAADATPAAPQPKKRKTAKSKEEDAMPLADRTAVSSLKKAMYIGAHVSAAGGKSLYFSVLRALPKY